jgi:hypothetical protein
MSSLRRYNPRKRRNTEEMAAMRLVLIGWVVLLASGMARVGAVPVPSQWEKPTAALAEQIFGMMGPGQAQLTLRNLSSIPDAEVPGIRKQLEQDLKTHGVLASSEESANAVRVTLSENTREWLWVAEVVQGSETRVAMVEVNRAAASSARIDAQIVLRKERLSWAPKSDEPILFAARSDGDLVIVHADNIAIGSINNGAWRELKRVSFGRGQNASRDPRGFVMLADDGASFTAYAPGVVCTGTRSNTAAGSGTTGDWTVQCREGDDPWPLPGGGGPNGAGVKAFFNAGRNYFTGVVTPAIGVDLPAFYSAGSIPRPAGGTALLMNAVDGRVKLMDGGALRPVAGTRDWGSDFAVLHSGCGIGAQVIVSGSGEAASDGLRAYEIPALEAVGMSAALNMDGAVTALWTSSDGKSVLAVVRSATGENEVDRVTALCN